MHYESLENKQARKAAAHSDSFQQPKRAKEASSYHFGLLDVPLSDAFPPSSRGNCCEDSLINSIATG